LFTTTLYLVVHYHTTVPGCSLPHHCTWLFTITPLYLAVHYHTAVPKVEGVSNLWNGLWNGLMEWTDGMDWWNGISANQNCQNSPSWPWRSCKCCLNYCFNYHSSRNNRSTGSLL